MPSLLNTSVAANYGRMVPQQTYGVGEAFTNFGTRQLTILKIAVSGTGTNLTYSDGLNSTYDYTYQNSLFSLAVRSLQQYMEVYAVYVPAAGQMTAIVAFDTANTADGSNGSAANTANLAPNFGANGLAEAAIKAALDVAGNGGAGTTSTVAITAIGASSLNAI